MLPFENIDRTLIEIRKFFSIKDSGLLFHNEAVIKVNQTEEITDNSNLNTRRSSRLNRDTITRISREYLDTLTKNLLKFSGEALLQLKEEIKSEEIIGKMNISKSEVSELASLDFPLSGQVNEIYIDNFKWSYSNLLFERGDRIDFSSKIPLKKRNSSDTDKLIDDYSEIIKPSKGSRRSHVANTSSVESEYLNRIVNESADQSSEVPLRSLRTHVIFVKGNKASNLRSKSIKDKKLEKTKRIQFGEVECYQKQVPRIYDFLFKDLTNHSSAQHKFPDRASSSKTAFRSNPNCLLTQRRFLEHNNPNRNHI